MDSDYGPSRRSEQTYRPGDPVGNPTRPLQPHQPHQQSTSSPIRGSETRGPAALAGLSAEADGRHTTSRHHSVGARDAPTKRPPERRTTNKGLCESELEEDEAEEEEDDEDEEDDEGQHICQVQSHVDTKFCRHSFIAHIWRNQR
ncbi:unnamed protein product [Protopolystoma xenopodis]|uniref:Uncharacterized protein n=1 Tax=Protopolystoma xenopodis TaxID=117903 RepID=A0A3S5AGF5_9PLAT|nr:unnamed protein product [Protopolystoma xenopodis]